MSRDTDDRIADLELAVSVLARLLLPIAKRFLICGPGMKQLLGQLQQVDGGQLDRDEIEELANRFVERLFPCKVEGCNCWAASGSTRCEGHQ